MRAYEFTESRIKNYKQQTTNHPPIRSVSDVFRPWSNSFPAVNFDALRHNAALDSKDIAKFGNDADKEDNRRMQQIGSIRFKNLFNPTHPDYKLEQAWFQQLSPEQQRAELKQHKNDEIEKWRRRNEG